MEIKKVLKYADGESFQPKLRVIADFTLEFIQDGLENDLVKNNFMKNFFDKVNEVTPENEKMLSEILIVPLKNIDKFSTISSNSRKCWIPSDIVKLTIANYPIFVDEFGDTIEVKSFKFDVDMNDDLFMKISTDVEARMSFYQDIQENLIKENYKYIYTTTIIRTVDIDNFNSKFFVVVRVA